MGTGLSPIQRMLLTVIQQQTEAGKISTLDKIARVLRPDGWLVYRNFDPAMDSPRSYNKWDWTDAERERYIWLRSLRRLEQRGLIRYTGRAGQHHEKRWVSNPATKAKLANS